MFSAVSLLTLLPTSSSASWYLFCNAGVLSSLISPVSLSSPANVYCLSTPSSSSLSTNPSFSPSSKSLMTSALSSSLSFLSFKPRSFLVFLPLPFASIFFPFQPYRILHIHQPSYPLHLKSHRTLHL